MQKKAAADEEKKKDEKLMDDLMSKHARIDGKQLTEKQKRELLAKEKAKQ